MAEKEEDLNDDRRRLRQSRRSAAVPAPQHVDNAERACSHSDGIINAIRQPLIVLDEKLRVIFAKLFTAPLRSRGGRPSAGSSSQSATVA
jgi:hypothetical protein